MGYIRFRGVSLQYEERVFYGERGVVGYFEIESYLR